MNPQDLALQHFQQQRLQPTPTPNIISPQTGPIPAGDIGHGGPGSDTIQAAYDMMHQSTSPSAAQTPSPTMTPSVTGSVDFTDLKKKGYSPAQIEGYLSTNPGVTLKNAPDNWDATIKQDSILSKAGPITETFGEKQPGVEVFSGGVTTGTGIGVPVGTKIATPPGKWQVVQTFDGAKQKGYIGDSDGQGWGNNIVIQNSRTGEKLRYAHLSQVDVAQGDTINGQRVIGLTGQSGNVTGPHLNLSYQTPDGQMGDVLRSQYAKYLPITNSE